MVKLFWQLIFKLTGWSITNSFPGGIKKGIIVVAPHTSNWDFVLGVGVRAIQQFPSSYMIKDTWLKLPIVGSILKAMGGVGVDRKKNIRLTEQIAEIFREREEFVIAITPEGTRKYNPNWKTGFWHIADMADVLLIPAAYDYPTKRIVWGKAFKTGEKKGDIEKLKAFFRQFKGRFPENGVR